MRKKKSGDVRICKECGVKMKVISTSRRLLEPEEMGEMTDAVASEYEAASMGGDSGDFEINQIMYKCPKCPNTIIDEFL